MEITANRKKGLYILLTAIVFSVAALFFSYLLCCRNGGKVSPEVDVFSSVPVDASSVIYFNQFSTFDKAVKGESKLFQKFLFAESKFDDLFDKLTELSGGAISRKVKKSATLVSSHYSAKEKVSSLLSVAVGDAGVVFSSLLDKIDGEMISVRSYNGISIHRWNGISFAFFEGFFIASPSDIVLESSVRHLASGKSIVQNRGFQDALEKGAGDGVMIMLNHKQTGKLFSGFVTREYLGYSDFVSNFTDWSVLNFKLDGSLVSSIGGFEGEGGSADYISSFSGVKPAGQKIISFVPATTYALLSVSVEGVASFARKLLDYRSYHGSVRNFDRFEKALIWADSLNIKEAGCAIINFAGKRETVTILRTRGSGEHLSSLFGKDKLPEIIPFEKRGYLGLLFGDFFDLTDEESWMRTGNYLIIGPADVIGKVDGEYSRAFSLEDYISQTKARNLLPVDKDIVSLIVNESDNSSVIENFLNEEYAGVVHSFFSGSNILVAGFRITAEEDGHIYPKVCIYADSLSVLPEPEDGAYYDFPGWSADSVVNVPVGPFEMVNHISGEREYLVQLESNWLRLADKDFKGIWAIPFESSLKGFVEQIDYYDNGNLQMLFASEKKLFLLDRTGRYLSPFPIEFENEIVLGPKVYSLGDDEDLLIMLLHKDNTLRMYHTDGRPVNEWNPISLPETVKEFPEIFEVNGNYFFALRTVRRLLLFRDDGSLLLELPDVLRLRPDSVVDIIGNGKVKVKCVSGKFLIIDMKSGKFVVKRN